MTVSPAIISVLYHPQSDRLNLVFHTKDHQQLMGVMTRRLFKSILAQLPGWMAQHVNLITTQPTQVITPKTQTAEQQKVVNQFQHQTAQQKQAITPSLSIQKDISHFDIETMALSVQAQTDGSHKINLKFIAQDRGMQSSLTLDTLQLHQLIGSMLNKVPDWDLRNPWNEVNVMGSGTGRNTELLH